MQDAFGVVIFGVVVMAAVVAIATLASSRRAYDQIGANGLNDGSDRPAHNPAHDPGYAAARDDEIRQMIDARNARRARQGKDPVDLPAELEALAPRHNPADAGLTAEVRSLVLARNRRRAKRGQEPLDVEAEIARQLRELS